MICETTERPKRQPRRTRQAPPPAAIPSEPPPRVVAVFRRQDNTICHARCGRPLSLQGVRGLLEADFYCLGCLAHVTMPLSVLDAVPIGRDAREPVAAAL